MLARRPNTVFNYLSETRFRATSPKISKPQFNLGIDVDWVTDHFRRLPAAAKQTLNRLPIIMAKQEADTKRPVHGDAIQKDYLRPAGEKIGLQGVGWHSFRHTYRTLIDDIGTPLGVQQRLMRHADIKTTMNTYGSAFEKTKRRANSRVADLVLPPDIKKQLKDRAKEVSLKNLRPQTAAIQ